MAYGSRGSYYAFGLTDVGGEPDAEFQQSLDEFSYLEKNATRWALASGGYDCSGAAAEQLGIIPSLWPVVGEITGHSESASTRSAVRVRSTRGIDIASHYGDEVRASADGVVVIMDRRRATGGW